MFENGRIYLLDVLFFFLFARPRIGDQYVSVFTAYICIVAMFFLNMVHIGLYQRSAGIGEMIITEEGQKKSKERFIRAKRGVIALIVLDLILIGITKNYLKRTVILNVQEQSYFSLLKEAFRNGIPPVTETPPDSGLPYWSQASQWIMNNRLVYYIWFGFQLLRLAILCVTPNTVIRIILYATDKSNSLATWFIYMAANFLVTAVVSLLKVRNMTMFSRVINVISMLHIRKCYCIN